MNKNIDLTKILKDCPRWTKLYSTIYGEVELYQISKESEYPIILARSDGGKFDVTVDGRFYKDWDGDCTLFPSRDERDWFNFTAPWYKKEKFDPKTLKPFDKVLVKCLNNSEWLCNIFSHIEPHSNFCFCANDTAYKIYIPYNEETKHLVGTTDEAPEFYRYWED